MYKGKPFGAGGVVKDQKPQEELDRLMLSRRISSLAPERRKTLSIKKVKSVSSPDFTAHLLRQVEPAGRASNAVGISSGTYIDFNSSFPSTSPLKPVAENDHDYTRQTSNCSSNSSKQPKRRINKAHKPDSFINTTFERKDYSNV